MFASSHLLPDALEEVRVKLDLLLMAVHDRVRGSSE
jgi:hypothetical protein